MIFPLLLACFDESYRYEVMWLTRAKLSAEMGYQHVKQSIEERGVSWTNSMLHPWVMSRKLNKEQHHQWYTGWLELHRHWCAHQCQCFHHTDIWLRPSIYLVKESSWSHPENGYLQLCELVSKVLVIPWALFTSVSNRHFLLRCLGWNRVVTWWIVVYRLAYV